MQEILNTLSQLEKEFHHPGEPCSSERIEALLHPDFFEVGKSGVRYSRQQVIDYLSQPASQPDVCASNYEVHVLGPDCALLTYSCTHASHDHVIHVLRSSIWRKTSVGWQIFYHQGTIAP